VAVKPTTRIPEKQMEVVEGVTVDESKTEDAHESEEESGMKTEDSATPSVAEKKTKKKEFPSIHFHPKLSL
jgi:hypothetical protein